MGERDAVELGDTYQSDIGKSDGWIGLTRGIESPASNGAIREQRESMATDFDLDDRLPERWRIELSPILAFRVWLPNYGRSIVVDHGSFEKGSDSGE
jgi:hypothetical protein